MTQEKIDSHSSHSGKSLSRHGLSFTGGEGSAILLALMPRATVSQRLRGTLKTLIKRYGHGAQADLVKFSNHRPGGSKLRAQDLSYFLNDTLGRRPLKLDNLDDIADFFVMSVADLFDLKQRDLAGDEQRVVFGFRALPDVTRQHFLALLESASVASGFVQFSKKSGLQKTTAEINSLPLSNRLDIAIEGDMEHGISAAVVGQLSAVAVQLDQLARHLAQLATHPRNDQPSPSGSADKSLRR